ncbi:universal stress protein family protein [Balneicella halophila]|uniref:Universal stress protein family protein n=1 Tax=Balneicella halophila TaxID=1537566 RepID=A0A7L4UNK0_BALHA|nr:hypothetical protein [Balneicella halophila]PVX49867.1 universal stress protein family protein [Balneicella halophila]
MANIILPVNFSREIRRALISFMKQMVQHDSSSHFTLLHAYDISGYGTAMLRDMTEVLEKNAYQDLEHEKEEMLKEVPNASIATYVGRGLLPNVVNSYEEDNRVDFMVVALKGSNMLQSLLSSNKPSQLAQSSNVPMLFLPDADNVKLPTAIAFGTDLKPFQNVEDFKSLLNMAKILDAKLHFVYVNETGESKKSAFESHYVEHLQDVGYDFVEIENKNAAKGMMDFIKENNLDGIGLIERKSGFLQRLFSESMLNQMLGLAKLPIMVINELREAE